MTTSTAPRLKTRYATEIKPALKTKFAYKNVMQIPTLTKVIVHLFEKLVNYYNTCYNSYISMNKTYDNNKCYD